MNDYFLTPLAAIALTLITGNPLNGRTYEPSHPVVYALDSSGRIVDSSLVDFSGNYSFPELIPGMYSMLFKKPGFSDILVAGVEHLNPDLMYHASLDFVSNSPEPVKEMEMVDAEIPDTREDSYGDRLIMSKISAPVDGSTRVRGLRTRSAEGSYGGGDADMSRIGLIGGESGTPVTDDIDAVLLDKPVAEPHGSGTGETGPAAQKPGQITAGYWSDLENWEKWNETNKDVQISRYQEEWRFYPRNRFSVILRDKNGKPVIGENVTLTDQHGTIHWQCKTDNLGKAELWSQFNSQVSTKDIKDYKIKIVQGERVYDFRVKPNTGAADLVNLPFESKVSPQAEIAFVVDATGSMSDEISYLQAELLDVIARAKSGNKCLDLKMGSVFYRDADDAYVTRKSDFSSNPLDIVNFIMDQSAGGGGDFPEAVDAAMESAITELAWSEKSVARLLFLVLDAPPHSDSASVARMNEYTRLAAAKGIKIIPITASGINQSTEFLMKYLAIATNGTYVYITDHSGVGNAHAKPTGVKENVQYLNDLLVELINANLAWDGCEENPETPAKGTIEIISNGQWQVQFYPNPATDGITIKSNEIPDAVTMYDFSGKQVYHSDQTSEKMTIQTGNLNTGIYFVTCMKGPQKITCRMLVMH